MSGRVCIACLLVVWALGAPLAAQQGAPIYFGDDEPALDDDRASALGFGDDDGDKPVDGDLVEPDDGERLGDEQADDDDFPDKIDPAVLHAVDGAGDEPPPPPRSVVYERPDSPPRKPSDETRVAGTPDPPGMGDAGKVDREAGHSMPEEPSSDVDRENPLGTALAAALIRVDKETDIPHKITELWAQRRQALSQGKELDAARQLQAITELFKRAGGGATLEQNMFAIGSTLAREAMDAVGGDDSLHALSLAETAVLFAPDALPVYQSLLRARLAHRPGDIRGHILVLRQMFKALLRNPDNTIATSLNAVFFVVTVYVTSLLLVALILLLRSLRPLVHDLVHLFPRGVSTAQAGFFLLVVVLVPLLFGLGPLLVALYWLVLAWAYLSRRERAVVGTLWLLGLSLPVAALVSSHLMSDRAREVVRLYEASRDLENPEHLVWLRRRAAENEVGAAELASLAIVEKRNGALKLARAALDRAVSLQPNWAWLHNNLGNILALQGEVDAAHRAYKKAIDIQPNLVEAHFNRGNLYFRQHNNMKGQAELAIARNLDLPHFSRLKDMTDTATKRMHNRVVADINTPASVLWPRVLQEDADMLRYQQQFGHMLFAGLPPRMAFALVLAGGMLLLLAGWGLRRLRPSGHCQRCGRPACVRCDSEQPRHDICGQCYNVFLAPSKSLDADLKIRKEIEVRRHHARAVYVRRALSVLVAGAGHVLAGAPVRGVLGILLLSSVLAGLVFVGGLVPLTHVLQASLPVARLIVLGFLFVVLALWAVLSVRRLES